MNRAAAVRAVAREWERLNWAHFHRAMRPPAFRLAPGERLGSWHPATRTLSLSEGLVTGSPWPVVAEVLKHEMAHQYVTEVLGVRDEPPHGPAFRRVCAEVGVDPAASGRPEPRPDPPALARLRKLLALAGSDNPHEAEAAARAAHRWMRRHHLDTAGTRSDHGARWIGRVALRRAAWERMLAGLLGQHFFVVPIWVGAWIPERDRWGQVLEISGLPEHLDLAEHVHDLVSGVGERRWREHRGRHRGRAGRRDRFLAGVVRGFGQQLDAQARACDEEGLVRVRDAGLDDFVARRHPRLRSGRGYRVRGDAAWRAGLAEGRRIALHRPVTHGPSGGVRGLLE